jgi:hypothetical protein
MEIQGSKMSGVSREGKDGESSISREISSGLSSSSARGEQEILLKIIYYWI